MRETTKIVKKKKEHTSSKFRNKKQTVDQIDDWRQVSKIAESISETNKDEAVKFYQNAIRKFPTKTKLVTHYAQFLYNNHYTKKAFKIIKKLTSIDPSNSDSLYLQGLIYARLGNFKKSKIFLQNAVNLDPRNPDIHNYLGLTLTDLNELDDAIEQFDAALKFKKNNELFDNKARAFYRLGKFEDALKNINKALRYEPNSFYSIIRKGFILQEMDRSEESKKCFRKILELESPYVSFLAVQSRALLELGMLKKCIKKADEFLRYSNYKEAVFTDKARAFFLLKKDKEAEEFFKKAIKSNTYPWANYYYATYKSAKKDYSGAIKQLKIGLKTMPWLLNSALREPLFKNLKNDSKFNKMFISS